MVIATMLAAGMLLQPVHGPAQPSSTCGEAERAFLASLAGAWEGVPSVRTAPDEYAEGHAVVESTVVLGGCGLVTTLETTLGASVRSEVHVLAVDGDGRFELSAVDSEHGAFTVSAGVLDGDVLSLEWSRDLGDRVLRTRKEYRLISSDEYHVEHGLAAAEAEPWAMTFRGRYRRR